MDTEERVYNLEQGAADTKTALGRIEAKLDATLPHLATAADVANTETRLIKWAVGTVLAGAALAAAVATLLVQWMQFAPAP